MSRQVRMALSVGRPSRRKNEPGIFPAAYIRSSMSTVRGKKSMPSRMPLAALAVTRTTVSPMRADDGALGLLGELAGLERQGLVGPSTGPETLMASPWRAPSSLRSGGGPVPSRRPPASSRDRRLAAGPAGRSCGACDRCWQLTAARGLLGRALPAEAELGVDGPVALDVVVAQVGLEPPAATDQLQQAHDGCGGPSGGPAGAR